jgi:hypothetical protein
MLLAPGCVVDLGDNTLKAITLVETVVETDGIHREAEVPQMSQQPDRSSRAKSQVCLHEIANGSF